MENLFNNFNDYFKEKDALDFTTAEYIYNSITGSTLKNDLEYKELWARVINRAIKYSAMRTEWYSWDRDRRIEEDDIRTSRHNAFITDINILSRYAKEKGDVCNWRIILGDDRKRIGDFACYIVLIRALSAR